MFFKIIVCDYNHNKINNFFWNRVMVSVVEVFYNKNCFVMVMNQCIVIRLDILMIFTWYKYLIIENMVKNKLQIKKKSL